MSGHGVEWVGMMGDSGYHICPLAAVVLGTPIALFANLHTFNRDNHMAAGELVVEQTSTTNIDDPDNQIHFASVVFQYKDDDELTTREFELNHTSNVSPKDALEGLKSEFYLKIGRMVDLFETQFGPAVEDTSPLG